MHIADSQSNGVLDAHSQEEVDYWYVMRDLKRANAKLPAYMMLGDMGFEVFVPLKWQLATRRGKRIREQVPFLRDALFIFHKAVKIQSPQNPPSGDTETWWKYGENTD